MADALLSVDHVSFRYGRFTAVSDVSFSIQAGERCALLGANGAGKTTLLNTLAGVTVPTEGRILYKGSDITRANATERSRLGIGRSFQRTNIFPYLSVLQNVRLAVQALQGGGSLNPWRDVDTIESWQAEAMRALAQVGLGKDPERIAQDLSYGEQRQLELAICLAARPELLLLDEPTAGMSPAETRDVVSLLLERIPPSVTLLIVEHDLEVVERVARRVLVMETGALLADGTPEQVRSDARVQEAYLKGHQLA